MGRANHRAARRAKKGASKVKGKPPLTAAEIKQIIDEKRASGAAKVPDDPRPSPPLENGTAARQAQKTRPEAAAGSAVDGFDSNRPAYMTLELSGNDTYILHSALVLAIGVWADSEMDTRGLVAGANDILAVIRPAVIQLRAIADLKNRRTAQDAAPQAEGAAPDKS